MNKLENPCDYGNLLPIILNVIIIFYTKSPQLQQMLAVRQWLMHHFHMSPCFDKI